MLEAIQGPVSISLCAMDPDYCQKQPECAYNKVWQGADRLLNGYFASITLRDLFEQGASHPVVEEAMGAGEAPSPADGAAASRDASGVRTSACACAARPSCTQGPCR